MKLHALHTEGLHYLEVARSMESRGYWNWSGVYTGRVRRGK